MLTGDKAADPARDHHPALLETSVPALFAVGDVRSGSVKRVGGAIGEGAAVVAMIHQHLAAAQVVPATAQCDWVRSCRESQARIQPE